MGGVEASLSQAGAGDEFRRFLGRRQVNSVDRQFGAAVDAGLDDNDLFESIAGHIRNARRDILEHTVLGQLDVRGSSHVGQAGKPANLHGRIFVAAQHVVTVAISLLDEFRAGDMGCQRDEGPGRSGQGNATRKKGGGTDQICFSGI